MKSVDFMDIHDYVISMKGKNMTTHFQATAPDGTLLRRSSKTRTYTYMTAVRNKREPNKWGDAGWASRRDLADKVTRQYAKSGNFVEAVTLKVEVITNVQATKITKSKVTDADKLATKVAAKLRKAGVDASKYGKSVRVGVPRPWVGHDHPTTRDVEGWYHDYFSEGSKIAHRNNRLARLIVRRAVERAGYKLDKNCRTVVLEGLKHG